MTQVLAYINTLDPFVQGVVGSAAFAFAVLILQILLEGARKGGKSAFRFFSHRAVMKHVIYRDFVRSGKLIEFTWGHLFVLTQALRRIIQALAVLVFFGGVWSVLSGEWLLVVAFYIALNLLFEAGSWLKDWSSEKEISVYDKQVKEELLAKFGGKSNSTSSSADGG
jgi:hypothetical protein